MANVSFFFQIREFVEVKLHDGIKRIRRIHSIGHDNVYLSWWNEENVAVSNPDLFFLPTSLVRTGDQDVVPLPTIGAIVSVFNVTEVRDYKVRFVYGMKNVFSSSPIFTATPVNLLPILFLTAFPGF